jgi:DNA-binding Lrp family transcriptional regulator
MLSPDPREARLLNDFQRGLPLVREPFAAIARELEADEGWVRATLARWQRQGVVSRVGAVFRPGSIGVSTLAAIAVPSEDLARVAALVSARPEVNHNYEREHRYNLWFVAAAADAPALAAALAAIERETGYAPITLPLVTDYWIDLGFDLSGTAAKCTSRAPRRTLAATPLTLSDADRRLVAALEIGLPLVPAPYAAIADAAGVSEAYVQVRLADWLNRGVIKRLGVVVRHRKLGFVANAMCVWDVPDAPDAGMVDALGEALAREPGVTLCYRRDRSPPDWRYNFFCMLHGRDRATVENRLAELAAVHGLTRFPSAVLFSRRAFKQCGARYAQEPRGTELDRTCDTGAEANKPSAVENAVAWGNVEHAVALGD